MALDSVKLLENLDEYICIQDTTFDDFECGLLLYFNSKSVYLNQAFIDYPRTRSIALENVKSVEKIPLPKLLLEKIFDTYGRKLKLIVNKQVYLGLNFGIDRVNSRYVLKMILEGWPCSTDVNLNPEDDITIEIV